MLFLIGLHYLIYACLASRLCLAFSRTFKRSNIVSDPFQRSETVADPCYTEYNEAAKCLPDFVNAAFQRDVVASSTCGTPARRYCKSVISRDEHIRHDCDICDSSSERYRHPAWYLTDLNNPNNKTCWISDMFSANEQPHNVSLTIPLGTKFEITYISIQFCMMRPNSLAIYKSDDFGKSWKPFQYYSSECRSVYKMQPKLSIGSESEQEALCDETISSLDPTAQKQIIFSTLDKRPSAYKFESSPILQDWVTATDLKIVLRRVTPPGVLQVGNEHMYYSVSDLVVGGRCKCNGHASKCLKNKDGNLVCDCKHNTDGPNCDRCKSFFTDRPWARATNKNANECKACECNLHARRCRFNKELYLLSGEKRGGVCVDCRHNTEGRYCHYCREGYYRDYTKPITHRSACISCRCHPIGALGRTCNQTTGKCQCKDGVTGNTCNKCAPGFRQSRSPIAPCIRIPYAWNKQKKPVATERRKNQEQCTEYNKGRCKANAKKLNVKKYCKRDFAVKVDILLMEIMDDWAKYTADLSEVYKKPSTRTSKYVRGRQAIWVPTKDITCNCPKIKTGKSYLILGVDQRSSEIKIDRKSQVIRWKDDWIRRLRRFERFDRKGKCARHRGSQTNSGANSSVAYRYRRARARRS